MVYPFSSCFYGLFSTYQHFRFGAALAKSRTIHREQHAKMAYRFLKEAKKSPHSADTRTRVNQSWVSGAELQDVINFLSQ